MASALDHPTNSQMRDKKNKTSLELLDSKVEKLSAKVEQLLAAQGTDRSHKDARRRLEDESLLHHLSEKVTAIAGLQEAITTDPAAIKYVWQFLFIAGLGGTAFFMYATVREYFDEPSATKVSLDANEAYEFPSIAICPETWVDTHKALSLGLSMDALKYSLGYIAIYKAPLIKIDDIDLARREFHAFYASKKFRTMFDYYDSVSFDLQTFYQYNEFQNVSNAVYLNNRKAKFRGKILTDIAMCHVYDMEPVTLDWFTPPMIFATIRIKPEDMLLSNTTEWLVTPAHNMNMQRQYSTAGRFVHPFVDTVLVISAKKFSMLPTKANDPCLEGDDHIGSRMLCMAECHQKYYRKDFGCLLHMFASPSDRSEPRSYCNYLEPLPALNVSLYVFLESVGGMELNDLVARKCLRECPKKCETSFYEMDIQYQKDLGYSKPARENSTAIQLYFIHSATYEGGLWTLMEKPTFSAIQMVTNVGGALGVFVGGTLMTLVQLMVSVVQYCCEMTKRERIRYR